MIQIGIIGAGPNGAGHAKRFQNFADRCRIAAVADPVHEKADELAAACGAKACGDFKEFLPEVDAVVISSPNFLHAEQAVTCARAGKHLWIEKPMALNSEEARRMAEAADAAKVKTFVGFSVRFTGLILLYEQYLKEGKLGAPLSVWSRRLCFSKMRGRTSWRQDFQKSGGVISELMAHEIDWVVHLLGFPARLSCRIQSRRQADPRDNDHVWMTLGYEDGAAATLECSQMAAMPEYYRGVMGREGAVFSNKWGDEAYYHHVEKAPKDGPVSLPLEEKFDKHGHFLDVLEGKCESRADVHWGAKVVRFSELALDSAAKGETITLNGKDFS